MTPFPILRLGTSEADALIADIRRDGFVALFGSALSCWRPKGSAQSVLPAGMEVTSALAAHLAVPVAHHPRTFERLVMRAAFEHVIFNCPEAARSQIGANLARMFSANGPGICKPNPLHCAVADLLATGVLRHVITTNYEDGIETACRDLHGTRAELAEVVVCEPASPPTLRTPLVFKVHGCAAWDVARPANATPSMVFHLGQEGFLDFWKRDLFERILKDTVLLVCGYSGLDFEICPELQRLSSTVRHVIWNSRQDPARSPASLSANARRVLSHSGGTLLVGDMVELLRELRGPFPVPPEYVAGKVGVEDIVRGLEAWELDVWRLNLCANVGHAIEGARLGLEMALAAGGEPSREVQAYRGLGQALFHRGQYGSAALWYRRTREAARRAGLQDDAFRASMDAAEAYRVQGRFVLASRTRERADVAAGGRPHHALLLRRVLLVKDLYPLLKWCRRIRSWYWKTLRSAAEGAIGQHNWLDYQQCAMTAEDMAIRADDIFGGLTPPLPADKGYRHLGYFIAESQAIRKSLRRGAKVPLHELLWYFERLAEIGAAPEMAKMGGAIRRAHGHRVLSREQARRVKMAWRSCEYWVLGRLRAHFRV